MSNFLSLCILLVLIKLLKIKVYISNLFKLAENYTFMPTYYQVTQEPSFGHESDSRHKHGTGP